MKSKLLISLFLVILLLFTACKNEDKPVNEATLSTAHFDEFVYTAGKVDIGDMKRASVYATVMHDERFYVLYSGRVAEDEHAYLLSSFNSAGQDVTSIRMRFRGIVNISGMQITDENNIALFVMELDPFNDDAGAKYFYAEYDFEGKELFRCDFSGLLPQFDGLYALQQAVFTNDGDIALLFKHDQRSSVYLLNTNNDSVTILNHNIYLQGNNIVRQHDDRVFIFDIEADEAVLREVDFDGKKWGDAYPVIAGYSTSLRPFLKDSQFDILISSGNILYGYSLNTGEQMQLLNWTEAGLINITNAHLGMFADGGLSVINETWDVDPEVYILRPVLRSEDPSVKKIVLTLGGLRILEEVHSAVVDFNRESSNYRIEVIDYGADGDLEGGLTRLQIELMTGRGPDIIYDRYGWLRLSKVMTDLYPFIDADPELSRDDFFPNFLKSMEHSDGSLFMVSDRFTITTMVGIKENIGFIDNWSLSEMYSLLERSIDTPQPLGVLMIGQLFTMFMLENTDFVDIENYAANLDNEDFIKVLEIAKLLPSDQDIEKSSIHMLLLLLRGEQLLAEWQFGDFYHFYGFAEILGDDFLILGRPSANGGKNIAYAYNPMGISAASEHKDGAWEFLRRYLLPLDDEPQDDDEDEDDEQEGGPINEGFAHHYPIRIDTFEAFIADAQTPIMLENYDGSLYLDDDGQPVEIPRSTYYLWDRNNGLPDLSYTVSLYAMSDEIALKLRNFVESAQPSGNILSPEIMDLIYGDLEAFFDGARTAEDTARIMQSRVQIYLSEQELIR